jgi:hypothetical protein
MIKMIDVEIAKEVISAVNIGDMVEINLESGAASRKVLSKSAYSLTVQGPTNRLTVPVEFTTLYRKVEEQMRMNPDTAAPGQTRRPGRPRKSAEPMAAPEHPLAGSPAASPTPSMPPALAMPGWPPPPPAPEPPQKPAQAAAPGEDQDTLAWAQAAVDDALSQFAEDLKTILQTVADDRPEPEPPLPTPQQKSTCAACHHVDLPNDICGLFRVKPPIEVIADASEQCVEFVPF